MSGQSQWPSAVLRQQARPVLDALYKSKTTIPLDGLDQLIAQKKGQIGQ